MRADGSLEIRFLRAPRPEEVQRPDRAGGARGFRRRGLRAAQGSLRLPAHRPRAAKERYRREREARAPHHAEDGLTIGPRIDAPGPLFVTEPDHEEGVVDEFIELSSGMKIDAATGEILE